MVLKPRIYELEQENETLKKQKEDLDDKLYDMDIELSTLKELIRQEQNNPEL